MNAFSVKHPWAWLLAAALSVSALPASLLAAERGALDPGRVTVPDDLGQRSSPSRMPGSLEIEATRVTPGDEQLYEEPRMQEPKPGVATPFQVNKIHLVGVTRYPAGTFQPLLAGLERRKVTLAEINAVAEQITQRYRQDGYLLVRSFVPAQQVTDGQLTLKVIEGRVNAVKVNGKSNRRIEGYAENIRKEAPVKGATLERNLLLINDLSGYDARGSLTASPELEGTDLAVDTELRKVEGFVGFDNRDSRYFGPWQMYGGVGINDPLGLGDHLSIRAGRSVEGNKMQFYEGQYELPLGNQGTVLELLGQHNDGHADTFSFLNANSSGDTLAARIIHPWIRSRAETLKTSLAFTWFNGESEYLDDPHLPPSTSDKIRALRLGASYDWTDRHGGRNLFKAELSKGLDVMGASKENRLNPSRLEGETDFSKLQVDAQRIQDLSGLLEGLNLYMAVSAQTSFGQPLLAPEQFGVGGSHFGRGYDPSEITGDSGAAGKVELQYNRVHALNGYAVPTQYYGYWDIGKVWSEEPSFIDSESLASAGFGVHLQVAKDMFLSPELAFPLTRTVSAEEQDGQNGKEPRFYINFLKLF
ncbi:ShlB/FhaC/HecB family hemolysin secretion/activation protein [Pseudomonas sp. UL073]|uniref:ShlB/FhaC/HecB family hemolysin secretion/activation protein n=1 Tax=Zestomonas insulae TaxID=2809017 RepID=A0ABS2IDW3_9GAMM|nr:ShlB/FhaC/HecB family hemolysin secretion/activation protein [Pseudomonas insulae]MBM7061286.1 ShlB/FhaC/HecB family hemolysin secretion/activation protein [Pseudomonas insulae]